MKFFTDKIFRNQFVVLDKVWRLAIFALRFNNVFLSWTFNSDPLMNIKMNVERNNSAWQQRTTNHLTGIRHVVHPHRDVWGPSVLQPGCDSPVWLGVTEGSDWVSPWVSPGRHCSWQHSDQTTGRKWNAKIQESTDFPDLKRLICDLLQCGWVTWRGGALTRININLSHCPC